MVYPANFNSGDDEFSALLHTKTAFIGNVSLTSLFGLIFIQFLETKYPVGTGSKPSMQKNGNELAKVAGPKQVDQNN
jgi:hypothetical protein